ncbi:MAG TPA: hypothetical protein VHD87_05840 [Acidimicrobiales bacterium]|nr:hypothetical protein [Acidimicrobiales bacterium]
MKARIAVIGLGVLVGTAGFGMAHAQAAVINIPAPPAAGSAVAVKLGNVVSVGQTNVKAGQAGSTATAAPITVLGKPILSGVSGASTSGKGALLDTGKTQVGQLAVLPWQTDVSKNQASSSTAVATAALNHVGDVAVAPSFSFADWTPGVSNSAAVSDGAVIHLGKLTIKVLHSDSSASAHGKTYLVQLFGTNIGAKNNNGCILNVGPLATVGCLQALQGVGSDAAVAQALLGAGTPFGKVIAAATSGGKATAELTADTPASSVLGADLSRSANDGLLVRTGTSALLMIALGMLLVAAGMTARFGSRKVIALPTRA